MQRSSPLLGTGSISWYLFFRCCLREGSRSAPGRDICNDRTSRVKWGLSQDLDRHCVEHDIPSKSQTNLTLCGWAHRPRSKVNGQIRF